MKIKRSEVKRLEQFVARVSEGRERRYVYPRDSKLAGDVAPWTYFAEYPHLLMPLGFDEYVAFRNRSEFARMWFATSVEDAPQSLYRRPSGEWLLLFDGPDHPGDYFFFHSRKSLREDVNDIIGALQVTFSELLTRLYAICDQWTEEDRTLWSPKLWTPRAQERERMLLVSGARDLLQALRSEKITLNDLTWKQLEEIVAEILRAQGLKIHIVKETPQGGRDIIARGELIPGEEPVALAVEVKHKPVVTRPEVEKALFQNNEYPALLFVTSGRFSAGVIREKARPANRLRLVLKDGVALGDMIRSYRG